MMENPLKTHLLCNKTPPHTCGYLPYKQAVTRFIPLEDIVDQHLYTQFNAMGYRRSGAFVYSPACPTCSACIPVRVVVSAFNASKSQKRCLRRNSDLTITISPATFNKERYTLYEKYINTRHSDGNMYPPSEKQFRDFLCSGTTWCNFYEFRDKENNLVALTVADRLSDGLAALYTFYEPSSLKRSLGTWSVLYLIDLAKKRKLSYLYLGYWIKTCNKMSYKCKFTPFEQLTKGLWVQNSENQQNN